MIIPWGTDAPIYHWPKATVGMIVLNCVVFFATLGVEPEDLESWTLALGDGYHPLQWLTHNFLHIGPGHLFGNMIFLWSFGIIVEGKLGWLRFLAVYCGIGVAHGALVQALSNFVPAHASYALGASAVIFGLLAMCLVWAPKNDFNCLVLFRFVPYNAEIPILLFALLDIGMEFIPVAFAGLSAGSAALHLSGAFWGFVLGTVMLKLGWVDCEGWDLYSVMGRRSFKVSQSENRKQLSERVKRPKKGGQGGGAPVSAEGRAEAAMRKMRGMLDDGDALAALAVFRKTRDTAPDFDVPETDHLALIKALHEQGEEAASLPAMRDYVRRFPDRSTRVRLKLAQVLIREGRPVHGLRALNEIPDGSLPENLERLRRQLTKQAESMVEEGVLELETDD